MVKRTKARVDKNQPQFTKSMRKRNASVALTHTVGSGYPDASLGVAGVSFLVELKSDKKSKLTKDEKGFHEIWKGQLFVCVDENEFIEKALKYIDYIIENQEKIKEEILRMKIQDV